MAGCGCPESETCGCFFAGSGDIVASGRGTVDDPMLLVMANGKLPTLKGLADDRPDPGAHEGQMYWEIETNRLRVSDGVRWRLLSDRPQRRVQSFGGADVVHAGGGVIDLMNGTIISPYEGDDPYFIEAFGTFVFSADSGDMWDVMLEIGGAQKDKHRCVSDGGWCTAKLRGEGSPDLGGNVAVRVFAIHTGGGPGNLHLFSDCTPSAAGTCNGLTAWMNPN